MSPFFLGGATVVQNARKKPFKLHFPDQLFHKTGTYGIKL